MKLNSFYRSLTIYGGIIILPLTLLCYLNVYQAHKTTRNIVLEQLSENSKHIQRQIETWTKNRFLVLEQNSQTEGIRSMKAEQQNSILLTIKETYPDIALAFTLSPDGNNLGRSDWRKPMYYGDREYFQQVRNGSPTGQQLVTSRTTKRTGLVLAKPIILENKTVVGVIAITTEIAQITKHFLSIERGKNITATLLDKNNQLITSSGSVKLQNLIKDSDVNFSQDHLEDDHNLYISNQDGVNFLAYKTTMFNGWTLIVQQNYNESFADFNKTKNITLFICFLSVFLLFAGAFMINHKKDKQPHTEKK